VQDVIDENVPPELDQVRTQRHLFDLASLRVKLDVPRFARSNEMNDFGLKMLYLTMTRSPLKIPGKWTTAIADVRCYKLHEGGVNDK
jgi:hypothetical protein